MNPINFAIVLVGISIVTLSYSCQDESESDTHTIDEVGSSRIESSADLDNLGFPKSETKQIYNLLSNFNSIIYMPQAETFLVDEDGELSYESIKLALNPDMTGSNLIGIDSSNLEQRHKFDANRYYSIRAVNYEEKTLKFFVNTSELPSDLRNRVAAEVSVAILQWSELPSCGIKLARTTVASEANTTIIIRSGNVIRADGNESTAPGVALYPVNNKIGPTIQLSRSRIESAGDEWDRSFYSSWYNIAAHEMGHAFGMTHYNEGFPTTDICGTEKSPTRSIMYVDKNKTKFDRSDKDALAKLYPKNFAPPNVQILDEDQEGDLLYFDVSFNVTDAKTGFRYGKMRYRVDRYNEQTKEFRGFKAYTNVCNGFPSLDYPRGRYRVTIQGLVWDEWNGTNPKIVEFSLP